MAGGTQAGKVVAVDHFVGRAYKKWASEKKAEV